MGDLKIARTVADARVGDLLWVCLDRWRKCDWLLRPVRKVGRTYAYVGEGEHEWTWVKIPREHPYDNNRMVMGWQQRETLYWRSRNAEMATSIRDADLDTLKTVAFALGMDGPPDFSVVPPATRASQSPSPGGEGEESPDGR